MLTTDCRILAFKYKITASSEDTAQFPVFPPNYCAFDNIWADVTSPCLSHLQQRWIAVRSVLAVKTHLLVMGVDDVMSQQTVWGSIENTLSTGEAGLLCTETSEGEQQMMLLDSQAFLTVEPQ